MITQKRLFAVISILVVIGALVGGSLFIKNRREQNLDNQIGHGLSRGHQDYQKGAFEEAKKDYDRALGLDPDNVEAQSGKARAEQMDRVLTLAENLHSAKRHDAAVAQLMEAVDSTHSKVVKLKQKIIDDWVSEADRYYQAGDFPLAIKTYEAILNIDPDNASAQAGKNNARNVQSVLSETEPLYLKKHYDAALTKLKEAKDPKHKKVAALRQNITNDWIGDLLTKADNAARKDGNYQEAFRILGQKGGEDSSHQGVKDLWNELKAELAQINRLLEQSEQFRQKGNYEQALKQVEEAKRNNPRYQKAVNREATIRAEKARLDQLLKDARGLVITEHIQEAERKIAEAKRINRNYPEIRTVENLIKFPKIQQLLDEARKRLPDKPEQALDLIRQANEEIRQIPNEPGIKGLKREATQLEREANNEIYLAKAEQHLSEARPPFGRGEELYEGASHLDDAEAVTELQTAQAQLTQAEGHLNSARREFQSIVLDAHTPNAQRAKIQDFETNLAREEAAVRQVKNKVDGALAETERWLAIQRHWAQAREAFAQGKDTQARDELDKLLKQDPDHQPATAIRNKIDKLMVNKKNSVKLIERIHKISDRLRDLVGEIERLSP